MTNFALHLKKTWLLILLAGPLTSIAAPILRPIEFEGLANAYDRLETYSGAQAFNLALDHSGSTGDPGGDPPTPEFQFDSQAVAEGFGGLRPTANATARIAVTWGSGITLQARASARSSVRYEVSVEQTAPLPPGTFFAGVPITVNFLGEVDGLGSAEAVLEDSSGSTLFFESIQRGSFDRTRNYFLSPSSHFIVTVRASAQAIDFRNPSVEDAEFSQSVADPLFTFNQAQLDAQLGANSFPLADYFAFTYSPGTFPVPEPTPMVLATFASFIAASRRPRNRLIK